MQNRSLLIKAIHVYNKETEKVHLSNVLITKGEWRIINETSYPILDVEEIEAHGNYLLLPGLLDSHVHGQGGSDFADVGMEPEKLPLIAKALGESGLSYAMATLVSLELETLKQALKKIDAFVVEQEKLKTPGYTKIVGVHLEGPFIAKHCKGAHDENVLQSSIDIKIFREIISSAPHIKEWKITLASDLKGAIDFIKDVKELEKERVYVKVFIGHTDPGYYLAAMPIDNNRDYRIIYLQERETAFHYELKNLDGEISSGEIVFSDLPEDFPKIVADVIKDKEKYLSYILAFTDKALHTEPGLSATIDEAMKAGAVGVTHLGNACREKCCRKTHRLDSSDATSYLVKWILAHPEECPKGIELIVDGVHLSDTFVAMIKKAIGNKIILVTDALGPAGLKDGRYKLGTLDIRKAGPSFFVTDENGEFKLKPGTSEKLLAGSAASLPHCIKTYSNVLKNIGENEEERERSIFSAIITNPRITSLSENAMKALPDHQNFVILNKQNELVMSLCNGYIKEHKELAERETKIFSPAHF